LSGLAIVNINLLARTSSKKKILEIYASIIKREQAKLDGSKKPKKSRKIVALQSESDDEMSVHVICAPQKKPKMKTTINTLDVSAEEMNFDICFSAAEVRWDNASIPMRPIDKSTEEFEQELLFAQDPLTFTTDAESIQNIVESKYVQNRMPLVKC
jgi:hypothetical protein